MNNLPAMTEAQRHKMISDCQTEIVEIEKALTTWGEGWISNLQSKLTRQKIALAALTAEPDHYVFHHPAGKLLNHLASDECKGQDHVVAGYTVPPAPVLRVLDGWKLVPIQPTEAMMLHESGCQHHAWDDANCPMRESRRIIWKHMIEAAPEVE